MNALAGEAVAQLRQAVCELEIEQERLAVSWEDLISLAEKQMVYQAMQLTGTDHTGRGHWYSCRVCGLTYTVGLLVFSFAWLQHAPLPAKAKGVLQLQACEHHHFSKALFKGASSIEANCQLQIGECGGAMQTATCPDCGTTIGGVGHSTADTTAEAFLREVAEAL